jgi:hypothetical protein
MSSNSYGKRADYAAQGDKWAADKNERQHEKAVSRFVAGNDFDEARRLARKGGLVLVKHSPQHYALRPKGRGGWLQNIYPGNRRLYHDRQKPTPPYLGLPAEWTLLDVVKAAVAAVKGDRRSAELATPEHRAFRETVEPVADDFPREVGDFDILTFCDTGEVRQITEADLAMA